MLKLWKIACLVGFTNLAMPALAQEYDDPAVAACQFRQFLGRDPAALGYKRANVSIVGSTVSVVYQRSVLNTPPKKETFICRFVPNIEGNFVFAVGQDGEAAKCSAEVAAGEEEIKTKQLSLAETSMIRTRLDRCEKLLKLNVAKAATASNVEKVLSRYGLYPVRASDTALRAE